EADGFAVIPLPSVSAGAIELARSRGQHHLASLRATTLAAAHARRERKQVAHLVRDDRALARTILRKRRSEPPAERDSADGAGAAEIELQSPVLRLLDRRVSLAGRVTGERQIVVRTWDERGALARAHRRARRRNRLRGGGTQAQRATQNQNRQR